VFSQVGRPYAEVDVNIRNVTRVGFGLAIATMLAVPAAAQQPTAPKASAPAAGGTIADNKGDISFGYGYLDVTAKGSGVHQTYNGWTFAAAKRLARGISIVASAGGFIGPNIANVDIRKNQTPSKFYNYEGGVRFSTKSNAMASGKRMMIKPFAEVTYGGSNDNATAMNHQSVMHIGGGADFQISNKAGIRVGASLPMYFYFGPVHLGYQFNAGLVASFSKAK
jgi:hypothetical protein